MKQAKDLGFLAVVSYGAGVSGLDAYHQDASQMAAAGFKDYAAFIKAVYSEIQDHADRNGWIPVYYNIGDEPIGEELTRAAENAEAYRAAFPKGPPLLHGGQLVHGQRPAGPAFPARAGRSTSSNGTTTMKRRSTCSTRPAATGRSTTAATAGPTARTCTRPRSNTA